MSNTIMANPMNTGVRRLHTLGGMWGLGAADPDAIAELKDAGYDPGLVDTAVAMGATTDQLRALPFPADSVTMATAIANLINQLGGSNVSAGTPASQMETSLPGTIYGAVSSGASAVMETAYGVLDFSAQTTWDFVASKFTETQQKLNALARKAPSDPEVVQMVTEFNSLVGQFANKYAEIVGSAPSNIPLASIPTLGVLPAIPAAYLVAAAILVVGLLGSMYLLNQRIDLKTQALNAANAAKILSNPNLTPAQQAALLSASRGTGSIDWATWLQTNMPLLILGLVGIAVLPKLVKKL